MATAGLAGFPAGAGVLAFIAGALGFALLGSARTMSVGADSTIAPLFAGALAVSAAPFSGGYEARAGALALGTALALIAAGGLRLGWLADLVSRPVMAGFMTGVAVRVGLTQVVELLGGSRPAGVVAAVHALPSLVFRADLVSVGLGLGVAALIVGAERINRRLPGPLLAIGLAVAAAAGLKALGIDTPRLGAGAAGLTLGPRLHLLSVAELRETFSLALVVAVIVMVQTAATARTFAPNGEEPDLNADLLGLGAANLTAGLLGAFPVNASPPRTALLEAGGARSQLANLTAAAAAALLLILGGDLLGQIPKAALAGLLLFVAGRILPLATLADLARRTPAEFSLAGLTALLVLLLPIQTGVALGVLLSLAHGVFTVTRAAPVVFVRQAGGTVWWPAEGQAGVRVEGVLVLGFQAPLSFMNAALFRRGLEAALETAPPAALVVLEASSIVEIDYTAALALLAVIKTAKAQGLTFAVARLESVRAGAAFNRFGVVDALGPGRIFRSVEEAVRTLRPAAAAREGERAPPPPAGGS